MKTASILAMKGGVSKTTTALHLAVAAEAAGIPAVVFDLDPQASAAGWKDTRPGDSPAVISLQASRLFPALEAAKEGGAGLALIDTAPHSADAAIVAAEVADLIIIPFRPGILDLRAIATTARLAKVADKPTFALLSHAPPNAPRLAEDAIEAARQHGLEVAPVIIHQRAAFQHSLTLGQTAPEYEPGGKAAEEVAALFAWFRKMLAI
jgi:chromosome partitioning protein